MVYNNEQSSSYTKRLKLATLNFMLGWTLITLDIISDYQGGVPWTHLFFELMIFAFTLTGALYVGRLYYRSAQTKIGMLKQDLVWAQRQAEQWRQANRTHTAGLSGQIQKQFTAWQLTPAEIEVARLLLKGFSHSEIAHLRNASERTIRDQSRAIYRKSGVAGRAELSAFFLEDFLPPCS
jgi:DNA-binding CsgD family transcriptional regulator